MTVAGRQSPVVRRQSFVVSLALAIAAALYPSYVVSYMASSYVASAYVASYAVSGFRLRMKLPPPLKLRQTAVALAEAVSRTVSASTLQTPASSLPELTQPVNDFAHVVDASSAAAMDQMIRNLKAASGDVVAVATVPTIEPYGDIREYANKLFENHGRGIGEKGKDNGLLILLALKERKVWIEVGYTLEQWVTDGFAG